MSQMLWGDAIYVRDFMTFDTLAPPSLLKLAAILHRTTVRSTWRRWPWRHDRQTGGDLQGQYLARLQGGGQPS